VYVSSLCYSMYDKYYMRHKHLYDLPEKKYSYVAYYVTANQCKLLCTPHLSLTIYLARVLCLSYSCHIPVIFLSVVVAERSAILYVLVIKLTKETRRRVSRGRDTDGEIGDGEITEGGCEETFLC
jgi:hypothetical protein